MVDGTSIKVLLEIPTAAAGDEDFIDAIEDRYNIVSAVGGYFLEEPPIQVPPWTPNEVAALKAALTKDLVVSIQQAASPNDYQTWATRSNELLGYDYSLTDPPDEVWKNIETLTALGKLDTATDDFWYAIQAYYVINAKRSPTKYELWWQTHRPIIDLAKGVMFYNYYAQDDPSSVILNVNDMAAQIRYESCPRSL